MGGQNVNKFILLEGLSGTGKTTIGKLLAERMGAVFYKTPPSLFCSVREEIDRVADNLSRFYFYLAGNFLASKEVSEILQKEDVVCDRYIYTTICYHIAFGNGVQIPGDLFCRIIMPTDSFLITCHEDARIKRIEARGMTANDLNERKLGADAKVLSEYRRYMLPEIDNSGDNPSLTVDQILKRITGC